MHQIKFIDIPTKEIHLNLYVDESKNRKYKYGYNNETIDYIMIMAIPTDKKEKLYETMHKIEETISIVSTEGEEMKLHGLEPQDIDGEVL